MTSGARPIRHESTKSDKADLRDLAHTPPDGRWTPFVYFLLGQVGWFACVLSAARGTSWWGIVLVMVLIAAHLWRSVRALKELKLIVAVAVMGGAWETSLIYFGLLTYPHDAGIDGLAPGWLPALWALFAAQFNTTYQWLQTRKLAAMLLGMVAGPLSFRAGAALGALHFAKPWTATCALSVGWGCLLPLIVLLSRRWDGVRQLASLPANSGAHHHG